MLARELRHAAADIELRDLAVVEVGTDRQRVLGADTVEDREDVVLLDELSRQLNRLGDVELVVFVLVDDLPPEDSALRVDVLEIRVRAAPDRGVGRRRPGDGDRPAQRDRRRRDTGSRGRCAECGRRGDERKDHREIVFGRNGTVNVTRVTVSRDSLGRSLR